MDFQAAGEEGDTGTYISNGEWELIGEYYLKPSVIIVMFNFCVSNISRTLSLTQYSVLDAAVDADDVNADTGATPHPLSFINVTFL